MQGEREVWKPFPRVTDADVWATRAAGAAMICLGFSIFCGGM